MFGPKITIGAFVNNFRVEAIFVVGGLPPELLGVRLFDGGEYLSQ
jgi:hypothetical protein